ncbi:hypothetical protein HK104_000755 [Borealophlyctis nickersoniae]|nr:hypothetical protein HK104_000755 [Borealophlyctis nickersoniae]
MATGKVYTPDYSAISSEEEHSSRAPSKDKTALPTHDINLSRLVSPLVTKPLLEHVDPKAFVLRHVRRVRDGSDFAQNIEDFLQDVLKRRVAWGGGRGEREGWYPAPIRVWAAMD